VIKKYGCNTCHTISGVRGADGLVGPPLTGIADRMYIGGVARNTPSNMVSWIENPKQFDSKTAMPNVGVSHRDAVDIASYLYTLR
jgi:cytochrome c2